MSKWAIRTAFSALFVALVVLAFGHGYNIGHKSQLTLESALGIGQSNFKCEMVQR